MHIIKPNTFTNTLVVDINQNITSEPAYASCRPNGTVTDITGVQQLPANSPCRCYLHCAAKSDIAIESYR